MLKHVLPSNLPLKCGVITVLKRQAKMHPHTFTYDSGLNMFTEINAFPSDIPLHSVLWTFFYSDSL